MENKKLGFWSMFLLGVNGIIGTGIFLLPGKAMELVGAGSVWVYLLVSILIMSITLCFAECAGKFNRNGAAYLYSKEAFGNFIGFEVGIMSLATQIITWASVAMGFITALSAIWPQVLEETNKTIIVLIIFVSLGAVNILGVKTAEMFNNIMSVSKLIPLVIFISLGLFYINPQNFSPMFPQGIEPDAVSAATLLIFFAFMGFENMAIVAEDMDNPQKNLPKVIIAVVLFCSAVYFLVQVVAVGAIGADLAKSVTPVADAACAFMGPFGKMLITIGTLVSIGGINIAFSFVCPRSATALAEDGMIPKSVAKNGRFGTPYIAIIMTTTLTAMLSLSGSFTQLATICVVTRFMQYVPSCLAVIILRRKKFNNEGTFRIPLGYFVSLFATFASIWLLCFSTVEQLVWGLVTFLIGIPLYIVMKLSKNKCQ